MQCNNMTHVFTGAVTKDQQHFQTTFKVLRGPFTDSQCFPCAGIILCQIIELLCLEDETPGGRGGNYG